MPEKSLVHHLWIQRLQRLGFLSAWVLVVCGFLICMAWAAVHAFILPRVDEYKQTLSQKATQALGVPVEIGQIRNLGGWWTPWFALQDVVIHDAQGRQALKLPQVSISVSVFSALHGQLRHLVLENPELSIRKDAQGQIWVAGVALPATQGDGAGADWFFSLPEFAVRSGQISWQDESRPAVAHQVLALSQLDVVVRNFANTHHVRLDFTPPPAWGQRLSLRGRFYQLPFTRAGDVSQWRGQAYADMPWVDVSQLRQWVALDQAVTLEQGRGALRVWGQIEGGRLQGLTVDTALDRVQAQLGAHLDPLTLEHLKGRIQAQWHDDEVSLQLEKLQFETTQGERWPESDIALTWQGEDFRTGTLRANVLDISAISQINQRLPIPATWREGLQKLQPQGQLNAVQASWRRVDQAYEFNVKGQAQSLALKQVDHDARWKSWPAINHLNVDFDISQSGGEAKLALQQSELYLPDVLQDPTLYFDSLKAQVKWQKKSDHWQLNIASLEFANPDASGQLKGSVDLPSPAHPYGVSDLSGTFQNAQVKQIPKYLPLVLDPEVRTYLKEAIVAGTAPQVSWRLKGDLNDFPYKQGRGEFKVVAQIQDGLFDFAPAAIVTKTSAPWPRLKDIQGELVFEQQSMHLDGQVKIEKAEAVAWNKVQVRIDDLAHTVVQVDAQGQGDLNELASVVAHSALNDVTHGALEQLSASGSSDYKLALSIPIAQTQNTQVQGSVVLHDNVVQFAQGVPVVSQAKGTVHFTHREVSFANVKGQILGGEAQIEGRLAYDASSGALPLRVSGVMTSDGLRQARELGLMAKLGQRANGKTSYEARIGLRRGQPELLITSELKGMALNLPAPLNKTAASAMPLRVEMMLTKESQNINAKLLQDQLKIMLGKSLQVSYWRDVSGPKVKILKGQINLSSMSADAAMPNGSGVALNVQVPVLDLDEWDSVQESMSGVALSKAMTKAAHPSSIGQAPQDDVGALYFPSSMAIRADELRVAHRSLHRTNLTGIRVGDVWYMDINARETGGYLQVRPATATMPAQLYARLSYLILESSETADVESTINEGAKAIPALDVVITDLTLKGKKLGRLQIDAINQAKNGKDKTWQLNKLNLTMPEAAFTGSGVWSTGSGRGTSLNFQMQIRDSGALLARLGMPDVLKSGQGKLTGELNWAGSPLAFDYPSLSGKLNLELEKGQFLKSEPGVARLLGVLSLQALPRRLSLDFKDVYSEGFAFDFIRGDARLEKGLLLTNNLQMKGVSGGALMEGRADLVNETQDLKVVFTPDINAGAAALYAATINPLIGITSYVAQLVLSKSVNKAATSEFHITGSWREPQFVKVGE